MLRNPYPATLSLADDHDSLVLRPAHASSADPIVCRQWDPGAPDVREAVSDRTGLDGIADATSYTGGRTVTLDLQVFGDANGSAYDYVERLAGFTHPHRRPYLYVTRGPETWRMRLRGSPFSVAYGRRAAAVLEMTLSFAAPLGYFESPLRERTTTVVTDTGNTIAFPITLPFSFGTGGQGNAISTTIGGTAPTEASFYLYGPNRGASVRLSTGETFRMNTTATIDAGRFVHIDCGTGAVYLDGDPSAPLYHNVDWTVSTFPRLKPGPLVVTLTADGGALVMQWRERRYTI